MMKKSIALIGVVLLAACSSKSDENNGETCNCQVDICANFEKMQEQPIVLQGQLALVDYTDPYDHKGHVWMIQLNNKLCVSPDPASLAGPYPPFKQLHLVGMMPSMPVLHHFLNKPIVVKGRLMPAASPHHATPIVMVVDATSMKDPNEPIVPSQP